MGTNAPGRRLPVVFLVGLMATAAQAQGPTSTCVEVTGPGADEGFRRLVSTEIDRHATHRAAETDCSSHLRVEILEVAGSRYLTGRINTQVPHREPVEDDIARAVERLLRVVLHNDPVRLRGPRDEGWLRASIGALKAGRMLYGVEAYQLVAPLDGGVESLPGLAVVVRREVARWHLAARAGFASRFADAGPELHLTTHLAAQLLVAWYSDPSDDFSFYFAGLGGLEHHRFAGPSPLEGGARRSAAATTFGLGLRGGLELFRTSASRFDLFVQGVAPVSASTDEVEGVVDAWVPTFSAGAGVMF